MALPYDAERVMQLRSMLREARKQKLSAGLRARRKKVSYDHPHHALHQGPFRRHRPRCPADEVQVRVPEARDWCKAHYPGSPVTEVGRDVSSRVAAESQGPSEGTEGLDRRCRRSGIPLPCHWHLSPALAAGLFLYRLLTIGWQEWRVGTGFPTRTTRESPGRRQAGRGFSFAKPHR